MEKSVRYYLITDNKNDLDPRFSFRLLKASTKEAAIHEAIGFNETDYLRHIKHTNGIPDPDYFYDLNHLFYYYKCGNYESTVEHARILAVKEEIDLHDYLMTAKTRYNDIQTNLEQIKKENVERKLYEELKKKYG